MRAAVLGSPIAHSLSPYLHRAAYAAMGLGGWRYEAYECEETGLAGLLERVVRPVRGSGEAGDAWAGLSLTMPLKRAVLPLLDRVSELAVEVGGANTVVFEDGRSSGDNTDVYGIERALEEAGCPPRVGGRARRRRHGRFRHRGAAQPRPGRGDAGRARSGQGGGDRGGGRAAGG